MENKNQSSVAVSLLGRIHLAIFPIYKNELPKFMPMAGLIFFTIFSFTMLRNTKDALLLAAPGVAAASLPFVKFLLVFPISIVFSMFYIQLKNKIDFEYTYYYIMLFFIGFFAFFNYVLFPFQDYIHPSHEFISSLQKAVPSLANLFGVLGVWSFALYYVFAELWGTYTLSVLFWQFANDNTKTEESKRFYPLFIMTGNIALIFLSYVLDYISHTYSGGAEINFINHAVIFAGICMILVFRYINKSILTQPQFQAESKAPKKKKTKLSLVDSLKELGNSRYILYIAIIVLSYGVMINIFETVWKEQLRLFYSNNGVVDRTALLAFMSQYTFATGVCTIVLNYISKGTVRKFGWLLGASITPIVASISCLVFLLYSINAATFQPILTAYGAGAMFAVMFGAYGVVFSKSSKYAFFDPTKEMSFIPICPTLRASGKAAVDGVGARLGKSGGGLIQIFIGFLVSSFTGEVVNSIDIAPYLTVIVILLGALWLHSVFNLSKLYNKALEEKEKESNEPTLESQPAT